MNAGADRVIAERGRRLDARAPLAGLAVAALLHASALALVFVLPRLAPPPKKLEFVPVTVVPAAALGVRRPLPPASSPEPAKAAPAPEPEPPAPKKDDAPLLPAKPEKRPETPPKPATEAKPDAKKPAATPTPPAKTAPGPATPGARIGAQQPQAQPGEEAGRRGSPTGSPLGTTSFGSEIAGLDNPDFKYDYYIDQLLSAIDSNWTRPPVGDRVRAIVSFRIQRDGGITELRVTEASGYNSFDLAALRAVQNAAPFPPLPRGYRHDSLGVNLVVR